jgi:gliding motility-associated-like protein
MHKCILLLLLPWMTFVSRAQSPQWEWARSIATSGYEIAKQVAVDPASDHVYVVGDWESDLSATFPGGANPSTQFNATYGLMDGFVAKYDQDGNLIWAFKVGGPEDDIINAIAVDESGNIYITGYFGTGTAYFSGTSPHTAPSTLSNACYEDFFLAKYNPDGQFQWVRRSEANSGYLKGVAVSTSSTSVYATGIYDTGFGNFGPLLIGWNPNMEDLFLIKYDLDGAEQWLMEAGSNNNDVATGVVADASGVFITGTFFGSTLGLTNAGAGTAMNLSNTSNGSGEIMIARYDTNGTLIWGQTIGGSGEENAFDITMDTDSLYITGAIDNNTDFPGYAGNPLSTSANVDIFISSHAKSDGSTGWVHVIPCTDSGDEYGRCMDISASGNLYVSGDYRQDLQFPDGVTLSTVSNGDIFVAAYTSNGDFQWAESAGSSGQDEGYGLAAGAGGSVYVSGRYDDAMSLGPHLLPYSGNTDGYLAKLQDTLPSHPNDTPCTALLLPVGDTCASQIHDNLGATDSGIPDPGCGSYAGGDVWFKAVIPPSGNLFVGTRTTNDDIYPPVDGYMWSVAMALYTGDCGTLSLEACYESNSAYNSRASSAFLFDHVPGDTVWIRIWESSGDDNGSFSICSYDPGHFPGWDLTESLCEENGPIDLDTTLSALTSGFADVVVNALGIPDQGNALGSPDGSGATLEDTGDRIILDLTDTIPAGETYLLRMRSNPVVTGEARMLFRTSADNLTYVDHSFQPEISADVYDNYFIVAEHPTRFLWIENIGGGGGFHLDGVEYFYQGTRGGTWSGPGVTGSMFDPAGLPGPVSITYSAGGTNTRTDSTRIILILKSDAGTLGNDTTVCSGDHSLQLDLQGYSGSVISWESSTDGFISSTSIADSNPFLPVSGLTETTLFRAIVQEGSCAPATSNAVTVTVLDMPSADPGPYGDVCGSSLGLQANLSTGTGVWSLVSGPGIATFTPSENDPIVNVDVDQYGTYTFAWTETNGICMDDSLFTMEFFEPTLASAGLGGDTCSLNFALNATPSVGQGQWSMLAGPGTVNFLPSDTIPDALATVSQVGTYTFQWTETNGICGSAASVTVNYITPPPVDPGAGGMVCGLTFTLNAVPSFGTGSWSQQSGPGTALFNPSASTSDASVTVSESGDYEFLWTESDGSCSQDSAITVTFLDMPDSDAGSGGDICGADFQLSALPGIGTGTWTKTGGPGTASFAPSTDLPDAMVSVDMPGRYRFTWTETSGMCVDQDSIEVNFIETLVVEAGPGVNVCGLQHGLNVLPQDVPGVWTTSYGPGNVSFSPSETDPMARVTVDAPGQYMFKWLVSQGFCAGEDSVLVAFSRQATANAGPDQVLDYEFSTYLEAVTPSADVAAVNATGTWTLLSGSGIIENPGDPATRVSGLELGENVFQWTIASAYCPDVSDQVMITVNDVQTYTVITPNNDGLNDVLVFPGIENARACEIIIYNRWGTEVYRNADYQNNWDGKDRNDRPLIQDTYYYILRIPPDRIIKSFVEIRRSQ